MPSTVIYISEITHPSLRGRMGCIPSLLLALGRFIYLSPASSRSVYIYHSCSLQLGFYISLLFALGRFTYTFPLSSWQVYTYTSPVSSRQVYIYLSCELQEGFKDISPVSSRLVYAYLFCQLQVGLHIPLLLALGRFTYTSSVSSRQIYIIHISLL